MHLFPFDPDFGKDLGLLAVGKFGTAQQDCKYLLKDVISALTRIPFPTCDASPGVLMTHREWWERYVTHVCVRVCSRVYMRTRAHVYS